MDPNATLVRIIDLARAHIDSDNEDLASLSRAILNLNHWIRVGGFLPNAWTKTLTK